MPIYEYKCLECRAYFEKIQGAFDESLKSCERCGGRLEKQWSLSGFQFKGEGWYVTDYAKNKAEKSTAKESKNDNDSKPESMESTEKTKKASKKETESATASDNKISEKN